MTTGDKLVRVLMFLLAKQSLAFSTRNFDKARRVNKEMQNLLAEQTDDVSLETAAKVMNGDL